MRKILPNTQFLQNHCFTFYLIHGSCDYFVRFIATGDRNYFPVLDCLASAALKLVGFITILWGNQSGNFGAGVDCRGLILLTKQEAELRHYGQ
jgi:hypothetical protein